MKKYRNVGEVPINENGDVVFFENQGRAVDWWKVKPKKYYWICQMYCRQGDTGQVIYQVRKNIIIKVTEIFNSVRRHNCGDTLVSVKNLFNDGTIKNSEFSLNENLSGEFQKFCKNIEFSLNENLPGKFFKFWPMNKQEVVVFKMEAMLARTGIISDF